MRASWSLPPGCSIVIPVLDDATALERLLTHLGPAAPDAEIIVVDAGAEPACAALARTHGARYLATAVGRARQLNAGAVCARGDTLVFLHADTVVPDRFVASLLQARARSGRLWGRHDVELDAPGWPYRVIEWAMNLRSRLTGIATGDQAMFVDRTLFNAVGGFPCIELMEDVALSARLRAIARPLCVPARVVTSARRWRRDGVAATVLRMWALRIAYAWGVAPGVLARWYR